MTNERACANDETQPVKPVAYWENNEVKGHALCAENVFLKHIERAQTLRDRQEAYHASLPTDRSAAISQALKIMHHEGTEYPEGTEEALYLSYAMLAILKEGDLDQDGFPRDAALYLADRLACCMITATSKLDHMAEILKSPSRAEMASN